MTRECCLYFDFADSRTCMVEHLSPRCCRSAGVELSGRGN